MMEYEFYKLDSFTTSLFSGNPAGVVLLNNWIADELMQLIASENNLSETAFVVTSNNDYQIRWFTPATEVDLCGHATLAAGYVLFFIKQFKGNQVDFHSPRSGRLSVIRQDKDLMLDFPVDKLIPDEHISEISACTGVEISSLYKGKTDYVAVVDSEEVLKNLKPDFQKIADLDARGLIVTAIGEEVDFVSRFFAPQSGIDEDPVTGSAHTSLIPLWSAKLAKKKMTARQLSSRGGELLCVDSGERCYIGGNAVLYLAGKIFIAD